jgi:hypothetical protein
MVVFDTTMLSLLLRPNSGHPLDSSGNPISQVPERVAYLVTRLEKTKTKIIIPTPVLSEFLVVAGAEGPRVIEEINKSTVFRIVPFDTLAAVEVAAMTRTALDAGDKRKGLDAPWAKAKYDRQIVAISRIAQATMIYSDDEDVRTLATDANIPVTGIAELPLPPENSRIDLFTAGPVKEQTNAVFEFSISGDTSEQEPEEPEEPDQIIP